MSDYLIHSSERTFEYLEDLTRLDRPIWTKEAKGRSELDRMVYDDVHQRLTRELIYGNKEKFIDSINKGVDVDGKNINGHTFLLYAVYLQFPEIVRFLIDKGADVNFEGPNGETALAMAKSSRNREIIEALEKVGARE